MRANPALRWKHKRTSERPEISSPSVGADGDPGPSHLTHTTTRKKVLVSPASPAVAGPRIAPATNHVNSDVLHVTVRGVGTFTEEQAATISEMVRAYPTLTHRVKLHQRLTTALGCNPGDTLTRAAKVDKTYRVWRARHRAPDRPVLEPMRA